MDYRVVNVFTINLISCTKCFTDYCFEFWMVCEIWGLILTISEAVNVSNDCLSVSSAEICQWLLDTWNNQVEISWRSINSQLQSATRYKISFCQASWYVSPHLYYYDQHTITSHLLCAPQLSLYSHKDRIYFNIFHMLIFDCVSTHHQLNKFLVVGWSTTILPLYVFCCTLLRLALE